MQERETKTIITPISNQEVIIKTWLTGRERRAIRSVYLDTLEVKGEEDIVANSSEESEKKVGATYAITGELLNKAQDKQIETIIISIDGITEGLVDIVLDMRDEDMDSIMEEISKIVSSGDLSEEDKKK